LPFGRVAGSAWIIALITVLLVVALVLLVTDPGPVPLLEVLTFAAQLALQVSNRRLRAKDARNHSPG